MEQVSSIILTEFLPVKLTRNNERRPRNAKTLKRVSGAPSIVSWTPFGTSVEHALSAMLGNQKYIKIKLVLVQ